MQVLEHKYRALLLQHKRELSKDIAFTDGVVIMNFRYQSSDYGSEAHVRSDILQLLLEVSPVVEKCTELLTS